jgi:hypothetical protein
MKFFPRLFLALLPGMLVCGKASGLGKVRQYDGCVPGMLRSALAVRC